MAAPPQTDRSQRRRRPARFSADHLFAVDRISLRQRTATGRHLRRRAQLAEPLARESVHSLGVLLRKASSQQENNELIC